MASNLLKISIFVATLAVIGALEQRPLWASNTYVSSPDLEESDDATDNSYDLLLRAARNLEEMNSQGEVNEETVDDTNNYYSSQLPTPISSAPLATYVHPYSNKWTQLNSALVQRRKIPEPSMLVGLIAIFGWFAKNAKVRR
jgi:hypothetical protein